MILFFYLYFTWLCVSWKLKRNLKKYLFLKYDSWFPSEVSKLTSVKYPWNDAFSSMTFFIFTNIAPLIVIVLTKCSLYCIYMIFWLCLGTISYPKDNFCFHESIFQRQIMLTSHRSGFWHLRRKKAVIFSQCLFIQNSSGLSWDTYSGRIQVKK